MLNILSNNNQAAEPLLANAVQLETLRSQLEKLVTDHEAALKEIHAYDDAERIIKWVEHCEAGSSIAEYKLYHEGEELLENIQSKLRLALEEQQRMEEESITVASNSRGREAERFARASRHANAAVNTMDNIKVNNNNND